MSILCKQCGKTIEGEGMAFCPYCGTKLARMEQTAEIRDEQAEMWIRKASAVRSYPDRKKILLKGLEACPGNRELEWEMLFIGDEPSRKGRTMDYSIIRCWVLEIYRKPGEFSEDMRNHMREQLFDAPQLVRCLEKYEDPERKHEEYLLRLCREYIGIFLESDNEVMGKLFGFTLERNKEKRMAAPAAEMIARMKKDEELSPERREQLWKTFYHAYAIQTDGKTEYLDRYLQS